MSKIRLVALIAVLMLVLSACANVENGEGQLTPGFEGEGFGTPGLEGGLETPGLEGEGIETPFATEEGVPVTGETPVATEQLATEEVATTEPLETATPMVDGTPTVEDGVPVTGADGLDDPYPNTLSEMNDLVVVDTNCEQIAGVDGFLVSVGDGQILYLVGNPTGDLGLDGRFLIPWNALDVNLDVSAMQADGTMAQTPAVGDETVSPEGAATEAPGGMTGQVGECPAFDAGEALVLNVATDQVAGAPVIADDQDVNEYIGAEGWDEEIRSFWSNLGVEVNQAVDRAGDAVQGTPAAGDQSQVTGTPGMDGVETPSQVGNVVFIETVSDLAVRNMNDEDVASVEDLIINPENGQITHAVLSVGGFLGIGDRYVPVPWDALNFQMDNNRLVLVIDADQSRLEEAPGFDNRGEFPSTQQQGWDSEFDSYWQSEG